jgi:hypothetical protein
MFTALLSEVDWVEPSMAAQGLRSIKPPFASRRRRKDIFRTIHVAMQFRHAVKSFFSAAVTGSKLRKRIGHTRGPFINTADGPVLIGLVQADRPANGHVGMA